MTASGTRPALERRAGTERSPLAHLLHALNQPLTGLQCSLELSLAGPRSPDQQARTLREGLHLVARMRTLVEALRELAENQHPEDRREDEDMVDIGALFRETVEELYPVAEAKHVRMSFTCEGTVRIPGARQRMAAIAFRLLESVVSLAESGSQVRIRTDEERRAGRIGLEWVAHATPPEHSPFSRPELGLLIASAAWEHLGGRWSQSSREMNRTILIEFPQHPETKS